VCVCVCVIEVAKTPHHSIVVAGACVHRKEATIVKIGGVC